MIRVRELVQVVKEALEFMLSVDDKLNGSITFNFQNGQYRNYTVKVTRS